MSGFYDLSYIIENANWSIAEDGFYITQSLNRNGFLKAWTSTSSRFVRSKLLHYGNLHIALEHSSRKGRLYQKRFATCFHVLPEYSGNTVMVERQAEFERIHTSCNTTKNTLLSMRVEEEKVHVIPLGVDTKLFRPKGDKEQIRDELKLGRNAVVVGSFQKDGVGWGTGEQPKLIKGPDILVNVIKKLASRYQVHVLLVGPARGFVVKQLSEAGISFHNVGYLKNYRDIAKYYQALDLYLVTSRIEGGPKAILESWAAGVPLVSTTVGMVPDIATDGVNAFLSAVGDEESIYRQACALIEDSSLRASFARNGAQEVQKFTWDIIARRYYDEMYSHLL